MEALKIEPKCIVFDGEDEREISREEMLGVGPTELVGLFECTAVYRDLLRDFMDPESIGFHSVVAINGRKPRPELLLWVERGFMLLYSRLEETFGQDVAATIWAKVSTTIQLEKCE